MKKFENFLEEKLVPLTNKFASIPFLIVVRNAMMSIVGLLVVGSLAAMFAKLPFDWWQNLIVGIKPWLTSINSATTGVMGLVTAVMVGYYGSIQYDTDTAPSIAISTASFIASQLTADGLSTGAFDSNGLLSALVIGLLTVKLLAFLKKKDIGFHMPAGVPEAVAQSLNSLLPITICVGFFAFLSVVLGFEINAFMINLLQPFENIFNTLPGYVIYHMACGLCFFCGLNSWIIMAPIYPILVSNGAANEAALLAGETIPYIITNSTDILIWIGGTGSTFTLVLMMIFLAKSDAYKAVGKASLLPGIFEINEPVIFGTPICMNPLYFFPFVVMPGILAGTTYALMEAGIIGMPSVANLTWRTPPIIIGYLMANGDIRNLIWAIIVFVFSAVCYYPFFKIGDKMEYDKQLVAAKVESAKE